MPANRRRIRSGHRRCDEIQARGRWLRADVDAARDEMNNRNAKARAAEESAKQAVEQHPIGVVQADEAFRFLRHVGRPLSTPSPLVREPIREWSARSDV